MDDALWGPGGKHCCAFLLLRRRDALSSLLKARVIYHILLGTARHFPFSSFVIVCRYIYIYIALYLAAPFFLFQVLPLYFSDWCSCDSIYFLQMCSFSRSSKTKLELSF